MFTSGFTITVITILLTQLPNTTALESQLALLFLSLVNYLPQFIAVYLVIDVFYYCKNVPPLTGSTRILNGLVALVFALTGFIVPVLCLLWKLTVLAAALFFIGALFSAATILFVYLPFIKYRKTVT